MGYGILLDAKRLLKESAAAAFCASQAKVS